MILKYILKNYRDGHNKPCRHRRAVSLIEVLVVIAILLSISGVFGTKIYLGNRDKAAFERSYKTVVDRIALARRCCVYYGVDVAASFHKENGVYLSGMTTTKTLPKKIQCLLSKKPNLKGINDIVFIGADGNTYRSDDTEVCFEGTLGVASVQEIVLKGRGCEKNILLF